MAYQQGPHRPYGFNGNQYQAPPPPQPAGHPYLYRSPSFEQGDDRHNAIVPNGAPPASGRYRSPSIAGMQNAELYMNPQPPAPPLRATSYGAGGGGGYFGQSGPPPPLPERPTYNPQQYAVPQSPYMPQQQQPQQQQMQQASTVPSHHQPYNPAAYQQQLPQYQRGWGVQPHTATYAASPPLPQQQQQQQPPPPPPRPYQTQYSTRVSPQLGQDFAFQSTMVTPPLPPRHQPLPPLPTPLANPSHSYTPPAPPPPPFSPTTDGFPSSVPSSPDPSHGRRNSNSQRNSIAAASMNNPLPPLPTSTPPIHQRQPSPVVHRRPLPNNRSLPSTPGTPGTPGPAPPPHSSQRDEGYARHPHARPLPDAPREAVSDAGYFGQIEHGESGEDSADGEPAYEDLMKEVEATLMGRSRPNDSRRSFGSIRAPPSNDLSTTSGRSGQNSQDSVPARNANGHAEESTSTQYLEYDEYSDHSDAEAEAGLEAIRMADEQDARDEARRRSDSGPLGTSRNSQMSDTRRKQSLDDGGESVVPVDMESIGGGFPGQLHYGDNDLARGYTDSQNDSRRPANTTRLSSRSDVSGGAFDSDGGSYEYPLPDADRIHPFPPARVDTGGTGGLSEPSALRRRMSFEDGDESTLAESEDTWTSGTQSPASGMPEMFFHPGPSSGRPLPPAPVQSLQDQRIPQLMPAGTYQQSDRFSYDQYGRQTYPAAPDAYNQLLTPSGTPVPRSSSLISHGSVPQTVPPIRSKTDADRAKILREQQRSGLKSASIYGSDVLGEASINPSAELLGLPEIPSGRRGKFNPAKLSTNDFRKCSEPWALSSILTWIREMGEGEAYLKEHAIVDGVVALFTHKVPTMNTADAETLGAKVVHSMFESEALLRDEEWVKFGSNSMSGVLYQLTGTGCYSPRLHSPGSPESITQEKPNRCYSHHCMRTLKKINLQTQSLEPQRKVEDWATFYSLRKTDTENVPKVDVERQYNLHEIVTSEDIYIDQLEVLRVLYRDTLIRTNPPIIDPKRRDEFIRHVFGRADSIKQVNEDYLLAQLKYRQQEEGPWISGFSDIFREWIRKARTPYIEYAASYPNANLLIRQESDRNVLFRQYLDQMRDNERSKRLGWDTYLKAPITRLQRYGLLLSTVHKHMPQDSDEKTNLQIAIDEIKAATSECDARVADMGRHVELAELASKLQLRPGMEKIHLNLTHLGREIIFKGDLQRMGSNKFTWVDCHAILFDHFLVLAKSIEKRDALGGLKSEKFDVSKVPIPMDLLVLESRDDDPVVKSSMKGLGPVTTVTSKAPTSQEARGHRQSTSNPANGPGPLTHSNTASSAASIQTNGTNKIVTTTVIDSNEKILYPFRVRHLGRTEVYVLYAPSWENRKEWCDRIVEAKTRHAASLYKQNAEPFRLRVIGDTAFAYDAMTGSSKGILIEGTPLHRAIQDVEKLFQDAGPRPNPVCRAAVNCATAFNQPYGIPMLAVGTDYGVFISDYKNPRGWSRAIATSRVTQIAVLEEFSLMIVISDKSLIAHHLDTVCPHPGAGPTGNNTSDSSSRRAPQKLSGARDVGFFAHGRMKDRQLVFYKKRDGISSTFKVLEPVYQKSSQSVAKHRFGLRKGTTEVFRDFDEFYIPSETYAINLFQSTLAIATAKGIEVMTLDKKVPLSIPDLKPAACASIAQRLTGQKPLGMFRLSESEFLLVFEVVGIYVNKHGDVSRSVIMEFVGRAKQACLHGTYLILVDAGGGFVEVRNALNGRLRQVISGRDVKLLDEGGKGSTVKICMQHPEWDRCQVVLEMIINEGLKE